MYISNTLISWYHQHKRDLPWRLTKDPYLIWLSEIILQQTRVEQGLPYYMHFKERYPDVKALALASEDEVMRSWQGLGYYSRARNLHTAAKQIYYQCNAVFPKTYDELLKLKGIGEYTAAAIASFAYKEVKPVLDGNVFRFLSRYYGIQTPINTSNARKEFMKVAEELIDAEQPDIFNQAIMEFGALHCKAQNPDCAFCPFKTSCIALLNNQVSMLPKKEKKMKRVVRYFQYFVWRDNNTIAISKRVKKDIWQNLYELPMFESEVELSEKEVLQYAIQNKMVSKDMQVINISGKIKHVLSHQDIFARFFEIRDPHFQYQNKGKYLFIKDEELRDFALPRLIELYLQK